jgi:hypothetical protein
MNYLTNYYKNLSEQLQNKVNILNNNLKYLTEMEAPIPAEGNPSNPYNIPIRNPKLENPNVKPYFPRPVTGPGQLETGPRGTLPGNPGIDYAFPKNPGEGDIVNFENGSTYIWDGTKWRLIYIPSNPPTGTEIRDHNGGRWTWDGNRWILLQWPN